MPFSEDIRSPGSKDSRSRIGKLSDIDECYLTNPPTQEALVLTHSLHPVSEEKLPTFIVSPKKGHDGQKGSAVQPSGKPSRSLGKANEIAPDSSSKDETNVEAGVRSRLARVKKCCSFKLYYVAINCFVLVGGAVLLLLPLWLALHYYAMTAAIGDNTSVVTITVLVLNGLHLVSAGVSGICGAYTKSYVVLLNLGLCALISAILLTNTFLQLSYQDTIESEAEVHLTQSLSRALRSVSRDQESWDTFHISLGCCGVRSFADWCSEEVGANSSTNSMEQRSGDVDEWDYDEQVACNIPESCCVRNREGLMDPRCTSAPTVHTTYIAGCLTHIVAIIAVTGYVFRALCIAMSIVALTAAILAMFMVACARR